MEKLSDIFSDLFEYLLVFRERSPEERPNYDLVRSKVIALLDRAETGSRELKIPAPHYSLAKFAAVAFTDELILNATWVHRKDWLANTLQMTYFQEHTAGETFFKNLQTMGPDQKEVLEVYFLCLCLGFKGELISNPGKLMNLRHELLQRLDYRERLLNVPLTPQAYATGLKEETLYLKVPSFLWTLIPLGSLVILYVIFHSLIHKQVTSALNFIGS